MRYLLSHGRCILVEPAQKVPACSMEPGAAQSLNIVHKIIAVLRAQRQQISDGIVMIEAASSPMGNDPSLRRAKRPARH